MKKGFTLIELLTVIAILGIITAITAPTIINVIKSSKEQAFIDSAAGVTEAARTYQVSNNNGHDLTITFLNGTANPTIQTKGDLPDGGSLHIDENGKVEYAFWNSELKKCLVKTKEVKKGSISTSITSSSNCKIK